MDEEVLVIPSRVLESLGGVRGFSGRPEAYLPTILASENLAYLPRRIAEDDPTHKQLVPYVVLRAGEDVYCYRRGKKGGERRLHDLWSIGVGGHVCREDGDQGVPAYEAGFARELAEEVEIESDYEQRIIGLVHDDRTPVGAVHLGIVHLFDLERPRVRPREAALADAGFRPIEELRRAADRLESWSALVLEHLVSPSRAGAVRPGVAS